MKRLSSPGRSFLLTVLAALLFFTPSPLRAQTTETSFRFTVTGELVDSLTQKPIPYATVIAMDDADSVLNAAAADASGKFRIDLRVRGEITLSFQCLGYSTLNAKMTIQGNTARINAGRFLMTEGVEIQEVTVTAQKPLVKVDVDKLTYSVEADPEAAISTVAEILRKVPQLSVDGDENVLLNGQSDFKVLVNGKSSSMMSRNFKEVIKSMPANSIKDIEVITNPSTKYESEGVGGIINIITNRKVDGYTGRMGVSYGSTNTYNSNVYLAAQFGKFSVSASHFWYRNINTNRNYSEYENLLSDDYSLSLSTGRSKYRYINHNFSLESSYEIDTLNLITFSMDGYMARSKSTSTNHRDVYRRGEKSPWLSYLQTSKNRSPWGSVSGTLDYQKTFRKEDRTFTVSYQFDLSPDREDYDTRTEGTDLDPEWRRSSNRMQGDEHTFQLDYYDPLTKKHHIEGGFKYIMRINNNTPQNEIWDFARQVWLEDTERQNYLDYDQHIFGLYGGYLFKLEKFSAKAGFRMEGTWNDGKYNTYNHREKFDNKQFNVVPYANISYMVTPSQTVSLSYTQRLRRPGIWDLNPYVDAEDTLHLSYGNPNLKSVVSHSVNGNYNVIGQGWNIYLGGYTSFSDNNIEQVTVAAANGVRYTTPYNIGKSIQAGFNGSFNYRYKTLLNLYISFRGGYNYMDYDNGEKRLRNESFTYGGYGGFDVGLWKSARFSASGGLQSSQMELQGKGASFHYGHFSLSQKFLKDKFDLHLGVSNPFRKNNTWKYTTSDDTFRSYSRSVNSSREFRVRLGFSFGKMDLNIKKANRGISNDDLEGGK